jgi:putative ABC transport system ATP-binding protein
VTASPVVTLEKVSKAFGRHGHITPVLRDVDLVILPGEKASLVGPSGCGKSTLLSLIAGLLRPDVGVVQIDGVTISDLGDADRARLRANRIAIALQADNLIPFLTAHENIELALALGQRLPRRAARSRALDLLDRFGVAHCAEHRPRQMSGGEAQRVVLAVSMANEPALLLADEIVAQLDTNTAAHVLNEVLAADFAVLYVTHNVALADLVARRYTIDGMALRTR